MRKITLSLVVTLALLAAIMAPLHQTSTPAQAQGPAVKMALLPILDVLPFFVAEEAGYFADAGIDVEGIPVSSALERDQVFVAGEANSMLTDLMTLAIFNQDETQMQIVAQARRAYPDAPQFRILAAPDSGLATPEDLIGVEIGISENTVIHYLTQRILEREGLSVDDIAYRPEPNIPVRFQLLMEGALPAVNLPDPLAQAAINAGAVLVADDTVLVDEQYSQSVVAFGADFIADNPATVEAFVAAWMKAAKDINADPEAYRDLWLEKTNVPDSVKDSYEFPPFPVYDITTEGAWDDAVAWMLDLDIVDNGASYEDTVNSTFIDALKPGEMMGDAANGAALFASLGCVGCHAVEGDTVLVGPSLAGVADEAAEEFGDENVTAFLTEAITDPGAEIAEGFANSMPPYADLGASDLADLIAYLKTLG